MIRNMKLDMTIAVDDDDSIGRIRWLISSISSHMIIGSWNAITMHRQKKFYERSSVLSPVFFSPRNCVKCPPDKHIGVSLHFQSG
jgi:hypothetical protein